MLRTRILLSLLFVCILFPAGCRRGENTAEPEAFSFVVYPGSRYLGQLTEKTKEAHRLIDPSTEPPPTAIYDTDATLEAVAQFYADSYGYGEVKGETAAASAGTEKPQAYYTSGDVAADTKALEELLRKMEMPTDISKASGSYRAAQIAPRRHRPRVTVQRPYFDVTTSEMVDRTLITMTR
ncbi:MAG TPA: hypothetical protein VF701_18170 [Thermoanaerobaculia bacterium]